MPRKKAKGRKAQAMLDDCPRYSEQVRKLQRAAYKHDIGYRVLSQANGHCRVDSTIDFWLGSGRWREDCKQQGIGLKSLIAHILEGRGDDQDTDD